MKIRYIPVVALFTLVNGAAFAADLPSVKAAPMLPPPPPLWTGFYVGLNAGYTWSNNNIGNVTALPGACTSVGSGCTLNPNFSATSALLSTFAAGVTNDGFIGGGQLGFNWQFNPYVVLGLEADIQGIAGSSRAATVASSADNPNFIGFPINHFGSFSRSLDYLGTVRGRLGWIATPTLLIYATGGLAYGGVQSNASVVQRLRNDPNVPNAYFSTAATAGTRVGWTAGGGVEWMFMPSWSAKVEYLYYDLGSVQVAMSPLVNIQNDGAIFSSALPRASTRFDGHVVRAGVNYHFNWGAPIVAKY